MEKQDGKQAVKVTTARGRKKTICTGYKSKIKQEVGTRDDKKNIRNMITNIS